MVEVNVKKADGPSVAFEGITTVAQLKEEVKLDERFGNGKLDGRLETEQGEVVGPDDTLEEGATYTWCPRYGASTGQGVETPLSVVLKSPLPTTLDIPSTASTSSTVQGDKYWRPHDVECWLHVSPENETSPLLLDAITEFQAAPPFPPAFTCVKPWLPSQLRLFVSNEEGVQSAWASILGPVDTVPMPLKTGWMLEATDKLIQGSVSPSLPATLDASSQPRAAEAAGASRLRHHMVLSVALGLPQGKGQGVAGVQGEGVGDAQHERMDGGGQPSTSAAADDTLAHAKPLPKRRAICIAELKAARRLRQGQGAPADLVGLCKEAQQQQEQQGTLHPAVGAVHQLYTHLAADCVLFGFISSWQYTWLARLVPHQTATRPWFGKLYLSPPISSTAQHTAEQQQVTTIGGVSWLQNQALQEPLLPLPATWHTRRQPPPGPADDSTGAAGSPSPPHRRTQSSRPMLSDFSLVASCENNSSDSDLIPGDSLRVQLAGGPDSSVRVATNQPLSGTKRPASCLQAAPELQLREHICDGCHGAVFRGTCDGQPAVIKLLGPSAQRMAAFHREWEVLRHLAAAKVSAAPQLLGVGHLYLGVHFLATALVHGQPLSCVRPLTPTVVAAAGRALAQVHAAHSGLLHGDIRLQNVLLVTSSSQPQGAEANSSSSSAPVECVLVDFGASSWDGTAAAQQQELRQLSQLLQQASKTVR